MHERPPEPPAPAVEPTSPPAARDEPTREHADELVFKSDLREFFEWQIEDEEDWPYLPQTLRREWIQEQARELFERLGERALSEELLLSNPPNDAGPALERALAELRLPRRYPLLLEHDGLLELTPLATELISIEPGRVRVHGAFFPNLLSNGVADGLVLPTFAVERVIAAAGLLMSFPSTPTQDVVHTLGSCSVGPGLETLRMSEVFSLEPGGAIGVVVEPRQWTQTKRLEFHFASPEDAARAGERLQLALQRHEFAEGTHHELFEGTKLGVTLPAGIHGVAVVRRLMMDRALESWWQVDTTAIDVDGARPRTVREMLEAFIRRSRDEVERRLRRQQLPADARLEVIEGLLRMAADERLSALVDAAESKDQARWALTHLGSLELTAHPRLGFHAVTAEPFSERQASAIVETMGLHRKLHLLVLERAALVAELEARASPFRPAEIDRLLHLEHSRVAAMAPSGRAAQWS
jgi:hypothetical protein